MRKVTRKELLAVCGFVVFFVLLVSWLALGAGGKSLRSIEATRLAKATHDRQQQELEAVRQSARQGVKKRLVDLFPGSESFSGREILLAHGGGWHVRGWVEYQSNSRVEIRKRFYCRIAPSHGCIRVELGGAADRAWLSAE